MFKKTIMAAAAMFGVGVWGAANAATVQFTFQPCGNNTCAIAGGATLDWQPGNVLALGGAGGGAILPVGTTVTDLYQANLNSLLGAANNNLYSNGGGGNFFTVVAGFGEVVSPLSGGATNVFTFNPADPTNFFKVYANTTGVGNDLTGGGFTSSTLILSGSITSVVSSVTATSVNLATGAIVANAPLDNFGANDYPGVTTIQTTGGAQADALVSFVDPNYFPDLNTGVSFLIALTQGNLGTPYSQTNPSANFSSDGVTSGNTPNNIGAANGITGPNFQFQADTATAFTIPEPGSVALLGVTLAGIAVVARRRAKR